MIRHLSALALAGAFLAGAFLAGAFLSGAFAPAWAHKFHVSLTQAEWNAAEQSVQLTIRVFANDLEAAISRRIGSHTPLDAKAETVEPQIVAYVHEQLQFRDQTGILKPEWVGFEIEVDTAWLYFELKRPQGFEALQVKNHLFFDLYRNQVNTLNCKVDDQVETLVHQWGDGFQDCR